MTIGELNGFTFIVPESGGKAGKGKAVTGTIQVRRRAVIEAQFRFRWISPESRKLAMRKAKAFALASGKE